MFFSKKDEDQANHGEHNGGLRLDTVIGQGATIKGSIATAGTLRIDGKVEGELQLSGDLIVGEKGVVMADITAQNISVAGVIRGNVCAQGKLDLLAGGQILGDIAVAKLTIAEGAILRGEVKMEESARGEKK